MSAGMKVKITATFPLAGLEPEDVLKGAKANRDVVVRMNELGYTDVDANVQVGMIREKKEQKK